ncbi:lasso peptide biosynthesis B2 protein [Rhodanobacter sp. DHG33]|uniref:lasso peptide biosynthesis B2 protein n=1 Tax=Rhodanobacter sp. DHG33 TaxID=2775921 RepID=UPI001781A922|nr:lasso peptide biosynthesis B2 protein [Rhodanobacter sp. DHG33]MBD8899049.1 lasso peptide biosynthesis B2 protein [Rhodanobacter sp. DHG33]
MPNYRLNDGLSFCRIDGRPIFLDTLNDRYFRLSDTLERMFLDYVDGADDAPGGFTPLIESRILTDAPPHPSIAPDAVTAASRSALESISTSATCGISDMAETAATVFWTQIQLKTRKLKAILEDVTEFRRRKASQEAGNETYLLNEALVFLKARKFVPIQTCCLLDSLSIATFLARRNLLANIVFGVTGDPFSAHCWAQSDSIVLNDTIGNTRAYNIIRVI